MESVIWPINFQFAICLFSPFTLPFQIQTPVQTVLTLPFSTLPQQKRVMSGCYYVGVQGWQCLVCLQICSEVLGSVVLMRQSEGGKKTRAHLKKKMEGKDLEEGRSCDCHVESCEARRYGVWGSPRAHLQQCSGARSCRRQISFLTTEGRASCLHAWKESSGSPLTCFCLNLFQDAWSVR